MKILLFANTDWYLYNFRLPLAQALRQAGHQVILLSPPGAHAARLQQAGFEWRPFDLRRNRLNPLGELLSLWQLTRLYRQIRPEIAHHFTIKPVLYGSLAARFSGTRVINAITGLGHVFTGKNRLLRLTALSLYRLALRKTRVIFQNEEDRALFLRLRLTDFPQTRLIPGSGVDLSRFAPLPLPASDSPLVILPGRLLKAKGVREFVGAAQRLRGKYPRARFALVGESDFDNPDSISPAELDGWQKEGAVEVWGWRENMREVYAQASLVCLPSYREGLSRTLLEAAACARPIITSDAPGCREMVRPGENGLLVPVADSAALAAALDEMLARPETWQSLGLAGRRLVAENFSLEKILAETVKVYEGIWEKK
ncbi:MAG: glycosyltransferase family 4 protein [Anaerolineales bacterium]